MPQHFVTVDVPARCSRIKVVCVKVCIAGLGFVGTTTGACLAAQDHDVVGYDIDAAKVDLFASGRAPVAEPGIDPVLHEAWHAGRLAGARDLDDAVTRADLTFVCVGAGVRPDGSQDTSQVEDVVRRIGNAIARHRGHHCVVVRSTLLPGTVRGRLLRLLEETTGGVVGERFGLAYNPEFMREGSAVADFRNPSRTVIGKLDSRTADALIALRSGAGPVLCTDVETAETVKYVDNCWHALKVAFANEIGSICRASGVDGQAVMDNFCTDQVLNISQAYLKPGFAFGGPCLPKDVAALVQHGQSKGLDLPVLAHIVSSNQAVIARGCDEILRMPHTRIGFLGLSYKPGVGDLRGSPYVDLAGRLAAAGRDVRAYDPGVSAARGNDAQRGYVSPAPANLEILVEDLGQLLGWAEVIVLSGDVPDYRAALKRLRPGQEVVDLASLASDAAVPYRGVRREAQRAGLTG
jgi:GDP-mannose 6-dehydrogenase